MIHRGTIRTESISPPVIYQTEPFQAGDLMSKTLCEMKKQLKADFCNYKKLVCDATHVCTKCGRAANDRKLLCKPDRLRD